MADKKNFKITPVFGNSLLMGFGAVLLGLKSISNSGFLGSWDIGQILIFVSYTFGLFSLVSFMAGMIFLIYPLFKNLKKTSIGLFVLIDSLLLIFLISDSYIYPLYRTHLNFAMIQMTLLGGGRIVAFSPRMLGEIGLMIVGILVFSYLFARLSFYFSRHKKTVYALFAFGLIGFAVSNFSYSWGFANFNNRLISVFDKIPLARPLRMNTLLQKYGFVDRKAIDTKKVNLSEGGLMNYPLNPLKCHNGRDYNILFLFVDTLRYDMLTKEVMPNTWQFAKENVRFNNHYSNGNNTRHGIFSLFTGLPGKYWTSSLTTGTPGILISALQKRNYEIGIFTGAPLNMPEFHKSIFSTVRDLNVYPQGDSSVESDAFAVQDFKKWQSGLKPGSRFFSFIFLDSVHGYQFPPGEKYEVFKPYWKSVNHMELNNSFDPAPYLARYKNAVRYTDDLIQEVLDYLNSKNLLDNTIVVISSDHGDEFNDNKLNFWGHGGNFTDAQIKVPLVIHWPGKKSANVEYVTSHLDLVPTLLPEVLGCSNPTQDYSVGTSIWKEAGRRDWVYSTGWSRDAFVEPRRIVLINAAGALEFLDKTYRPTKDQTIPPYLSEVLKENSRYVK
ncbi:sulfatase-like hydrolase/transferase [Parasutterella excrementihominis]|uniref:sulfatase-like hydrolase/transferase n=1 Tax=Parasutterella excrementihominis TaxID=487175 RepID=UPI003A91A1B9